MGVGLLQTGRGSGTARPGGDGPRRLIRLLLVEAGASSLGCEQQLLDVRKLRLKVVAQCRQGRLDTVSYTHLRAHET